MSLKQIEREEIEAATDKFTEDVSFGELLGGLSGTGCGNLLADKIVIARVPAKKLEAPHTPLDGSALYTPSSSHSSDLSNKMFIGVMVGALVLFYFSRRV